MLDSQLVRGSFNFQYSNAQLVNGWMPFNRLPAYSTQRINYGASLEQVDEHSAIGHTTTAPEAVSDASFADEPTSVGFVGAARHGRVDDVDGRIIRGNFYMLDINLQPLAQWFETPKFVHISLWYDIQDTQNDNRAYDGVRVHSWDIGRLAVHNTFKWFVGTRGVNNPVVITTGLALLDKALIKFPLRLVLKHQTIEDNAWATAEHQFSISVVIYDTEYEISTRILWGESESPSESSGPSSWGSLGEV